MQTKRPENYFRNNKFEEKRLTKSKNKKKMGMLVMLVEPEPRYARKKFSLKKNFH